MSNEVEVRCNTCGSNLNDRTTLPAGVDGLLTALQAPVGLWDGEVGVDVLPRVHTAILRLENDYDALKRGYDTRSGTPDEWSRVDFVGPFLRSLRDAICANPHAIISVR